MPLNPRLTAAHRQAVSLLSHISFPFSAEARVAPDWPYLSLDHVDPPRAQLPHAVVDVHHALSLRHVQHDVDDDEAACPTGSGAVDKVEIVE